MKWNRINTEPARLKKKFSGLHFFVALPLLQLLFKLTEFWDELIYPSFKPLIFKLLMIPNAQHNIDLFLVKNQLASYSYGTSMCWNIFVTNQYSSRKNLL